MDSTQAGPEAGGGDEAAGMEEVQQNQNLGLQGWGRWIRPKCPSVKYMATFPNMPFQWPLNPLKPEGTWEVM